MSSHARKIGWMGLIGLVSCGGSIAGAQSGVGETPAPANYGPTSATVEAIMETAVRNIGRRYNLNQEQLQYTDELMKREVRRFLVEHEAEVWPAIRDILSSGMGTTLPESPDEIMRMGKLIRPIAKFAREAIFRSNKEWRKFLTDDQKLMHDFDMEQMGETFDYIDENLSAWEKGKTVDDRKFFPQPTGDPAPPIPHRPRIKLGDGPPLIEPPISVLATFVEEFIADYELGEGQITSARSILVEFKAKAEQFKNNNKEQFRKIASARSRAETKRDLAEIKRIMRLHKDALQPFYSLFSGMEERLKALLTSSQLVRYEDRNRPEEAPQARAKRPADTERDAEGDAERDTESKPAVPPKTDQPEKTGVKDSND